MNLKFWKTKSKEPEEIEKTLIFDQIADNCKVMVVENIGAWSKKTFGAPNTVLEIRDGVLITKRKCWNIDFINKDERFWIYKTRFKLISTSNISFLGLTDIVSEKPDETINAVNMASEIKKGGNEMDKYFKVKVISNIGKCSASTFGSLGTVLNVKDGYLIDYNGKRWGDGRWSSGYSDKDFDKFETIDHINHFFNKIPLYTTEFELVEEKKPVIYTNYELMKLIHKQYDNMKGKKFKIIDIGEGEAHVAYYINYITRLDEGDVVHVNMSQERNIKGLFDEYGRLVYFLGEVLLQEVDIQKEKIQKKIKELEETSNQLKKQIKELKEKI